MDGSSTGEVNAAHPRHPAGRIPSPTGNGIVDDGRPDEHEHDTWEHPAAFGNSAYGESNTNCTISYPVPLNIFERPLLRDGSKHSLVDGKQQIRDSFAADGWCGQDIPKANVGQVSNVSSGRMRKGQGVAPEKPLK